ncbi:MAG TPA: S1/P1 nuclease [Burkholderiaceae bacterium]|jgi:hypothetical protein|nr:S1/P1 nuclease [Burkholderiaceae bacterium]
MPHIRHLTLSLILATLPGIALAWNAQGHEEVGAIADQMIVGTHAEQWVKYLLGDSNLQTVSVWADCAKGVKSIDGKTLAYQDNPQYVECAPFSGTQGAQRFESFVARNWKQCGTAHGAEFCHNQYHYTDVSNLRDHYQADYVGTNTHDIVHAINAAIAVLRGQTPAAPFDIADKREALMLLAHYVGDIAQPLHVSALYLDANGKVIDPDASGYKIGYDTAGGNNIVDGKKLLHGEWDAPPASPAAFTDQVAELLQLAKHVPSTSGSLNSWSTAWATDSIRVSRQVFAGLHFSMKPAEGGNNENLPEKWDVSGIDADYQSRADAIKMRQLAKAGARLAQVLETIWPNDQALPPAVAK